MSKELLKEAFRFQQIAGLRPINEFNGFYEADAEEEDLDPEEDKPEVRKDAPDPSLDTADPEDLASKVSAKDIAAADKGISKMTNDVERLRYLQGQKDSLVKMYKSGTIGIDNYKKMIGTIPQEIKKLEAKLNRDLTIGDED